MQRYRKLFHHAVPALACASALIAGQVAAADEPYVHPASRKVESKNMRLVGYNDLQARSAYQPVIHHQGDR